MTDLLFSMLWGLIISCVCFGLLPYFGGTYWQKVSDLSRLAVLRRQIERVLSSLLSSIPIVRDYFGGVSQQKLLFVPDADTKPEEDHEISEVALFRFLLNEETTEQLRENEADLPEMLGVLKYIDKQSEITEIETHQSSMGSVTDSSKAFHVFMVFKSTSETDGDYWWSLEKNLDYIVLQRCRNKDNVKNKLEGEERKKVKPILKEKKGYLQGKGTIKDLFAVLWAHQIVAEKYHLMESNCQSLVTFVSKQITEIGYEFEGYFKYSPPPENDRDTKMLDLINILRVSSEWHPLITLIQIENIDLFDQISKSGEYNMLSITQDGLAPLNIAIRFSKTKMVEHLLKPPYSAEPTTRDASGMDALQMAAVYMKKPGIFDLLLAHSKVNVDDIDELGRTALYMAAYASNVAAVKHLLARGANPNILDKEGRSPLHHAAFRNRGTEILDLILEAKKASKEGNQVIDDVDDKGRTALHYAATSSNEITAKHLINKGADIHCRDNDGHTSLHYAAYFAKDMQIIDFFLQNIKERDIEQYKKDATLLPYAYCNEHDLGKKIINQLVAKEIVSIEKVQNPQVLEALNSAKLRRSISNEHGLGGGMANLMEEKGAVEAGTDWGIPSVCEIIREKKAFKAKAGSIAHIIVDNAVKMKEKFDQVFQLALAKAIEKSDVERACRLFKEFGADISTWTWKEEKCNALHLASFHAKTNMIDFILQKGKFDINGVDLGGWTPLHHAIVGSNAATNARHLLEKGADPTRYQKNGLTPFHLAVMWVNKDLHELLQSTDERNKSGETAKLSEPFRKTDFYSRSLGGGTDVLHAATELFDIILETGKIDINGRNALNGMTALHYALGAKNMTIARYLLEKGADPTIGSDIGITSFHMAAAYVRETDILELFLANSNQFDIDHRNQFGMTALHMAIKESNTATTRFLLSRGADPNAADQHGLTPLHWAARNAKDMDMVELLLNHKDTNVNCLTNDGHSALDYATMNKQGLGKLVSEAKFANLLMGTNSHGSRRKD